MATAQQIRDDIDSRLATLYAAIRTRQAAYLAAKGRYFQGLPTHSAQPADGVLVAPDRKNAKPHYQAEDWPACGATLPATMPFSLRIDQYVSPQGPGWVATVSVTKGQGPEDRDQAWHQIQPPEG